MARPRIQEPAAVLVAARDVFWERGYELTSIGELEERTGASRSSLYHTFGSKRQLFDHAVRSYVDTVTTPMLRGMREPDAGLDAVAAFFGARAAAFRNDPERALRGCLLINMMATSDASDDLVVREASAHRERLYEAFATALGTAVDRGETDADVVPARARMLISATIGAFLTARTDPSMAAVMCESIAAEVRSWRRGEVTVPDGDLVPVESTG
ncbi:TetR/AcrR family transcriptional regulator [Haloechinothrix halophila]|uniref:TetR/AcrR family transcriptional regulator n=1 Tax=Haloechinothrix halophila TaxID=1069073 RepID=UPI000686E0E9|nr:TetR/AcrR family transcriptional regulator [Haloechinothrix halophila]